MVNGIGGDKDEETNITKMEASVLKLELEDRGVGPDGENYTGEVEVLAQQQV